MDLRKDYGYRADVAVDPLHTPSRACSSRRALGLLALGALLCLGAASRGTPSAEVRTLRLEWEPGPLAGSSAVSLALLETCPADLRAPPGLKRARFASHALGDVGRLSIALETEPGHERIWIDHDFDGDCSDDAYGRWEVPGTRPRRTEMLLVPFTDQRRPVPVEVQIVGTSASTLQLVCRIHRVGQAVIGGRSRLLALVDGNQDLCFDHPERDLLLVDVDGDGKLRSDLASHERFPCGAAFRVGAEGWQVRVTSPSGLALELEPVKPPPAPRARTWMTGTSPQAGLRLPAPAESLAEIEARLERERGLPYAQRYTAIGLLGRLGSEPAFARLQKIAAEDELATVRAAAVRAMGNPAFEAQGRALAAYCENDAPLVISGAIDAMHRMDHPGREALYVRLLGSNHATVVGAAARHLGYLGTKSAHAAALRACREHPAPAARHQAYVGLRYLPEGPPPELLLELATSTYEPTRAQALRDLLALDHPRTRELALQAAKRRPVSQVLGTALGEVLGAQGDAASAEVLVELAVDAPAAVAPALIKALAPLRSEEVIEVLIEAASAKQERIRLLAAEVLAGIVQADTTAALLKRARKEREPEVELALLRALGNHGDPAAVPTLLRAAKKKGERRSTAVRSLARLGFENDKARQFLIGLLDSKLAEDRILAADAAGASGRVALGRKLLELCDDGHWEVRLTAAEALRKLRSRDWVEPLIERLEREEVRRVRGAIGVTLLELTGMHLRQNAELWRRWFTENGESFELPEEIPTPLPTSAGGTVASFYGIPVDSERIVFVIDRSGSMSAFDTSRRSRGGGDGDGKHEGPAQARRNRLEVALQQVAQATALLADDARVDVILFDQAFYPWREELVRLSRQNRTALAKHLDGQRPTGGTNIFDALEAAIQTEGVDTVMLLSDGVPGSGRYVASADILRVVGEINQTRRIAVHCVSLGRDSDLLRRLAEQNGGRYVRH